MIRLNKSNSISVYARHMLVSEINPDFMQLAWNAIEKQGNLLYEKLIAIIIRKVQKSGNDCRVLGDDLQNFNVWDEFCAQRQTQESLYFQLQYDFIEGICEQEIEAIKNKNQNDYYTLTLYLSACHHPNFDETFDCVWADSEFVQIVMHEIDKIGHNYCNRKIDEFIG